MAFLPGLKKQINKASQLFNEKIGVVEGTKLNEEFLEMERKVDLTSELVDELISRTREFLQPNPASRSKMVLNAKVAQNARVRSYNQPEGNLGEAILNVARKYSEDSPYVRSLLETGEAFKQMAEMKYALEDDVRQDFLEPLSQLQTKDLQEVMQHRKKLLNRRLDFDCKKRRRGTSGSIAGDELKLAEVKFEESFNSASQAMHNLLQNDVEQMSQLVALVESLKAYYKSCASILDSLAGKLGALRDESAGRQQSQYVLKKLNELNIAQAPEPAHNTGDSNSKETFGRKYGLCVALYDFRAENDGELGFKEGQTLKLFEQIDEDWYEGALDGPDGQLKTGVFPTNYVRITQPIPTQ